MSTKLWNDRLLHDCALMGAEHCVDMLRTLLREDEILTAKEEFYHVVKASIEVFCIQQERLAQRLAPLQN